MKKESEDIFDKATKTAGAYRAGAQMGPQAGSAAPMETPAICKGATGTYRACSSGDVAPIEEALPGMLNEGPEPVVFISPGNNGSVRRVVSPAEASSLPSGSAERKTYPMCTGLLDYFPDACAEVAHVSYIGNEQHNPGEKLHWARGKSMDQEDCIVRHLTQRGKRDVDGTRHSAKLAWRALAALQLEIEKDR